MQKTLYTSLRREDEGLENWGVKRAPFIVLASTDMPAVLAEVGCISNEKESAMLRRPEYRQQIAAALFEGIRAWGAGPTIVIITATPLVNLALSPFFGRKISAASAIAFVLLL